MEEWQRLVLERVLSGERIVMLTVPRPYAASERRHRPGPGIAIDLAGSLEPMQVRCAECGEPWPCAESVPSGDQP